MMRLLVALLKKVSLLWMMKLQRNAAVSTNQSAVNYTSCLCVQRQLVCQRQQRKPLVAKV